MRRGLAALAGLAVAIGTVAAGAGAGVAHADPIRISVDRATLTEPLPQSFVGLALEYRTIPQWVGSASTPQTVDPVLVGLVRALSGPGEPVIRIGGQSTDRTWWPTPGIAQPTGVTYSLGPAWATAARSLAQALHARYILSVNLEADSVPLARYEAQQLLSGVGSANVSDLEIGNEAALYRVTPWYRTNGTQILPWYDATGTAVFARPPTYNIYSFLADFRRFESAIPSTTPIAGPDAVSSSWLGPFSALVTPHGRIGMLDSHAYALQNCVTDPGSPVYPTVPNLLSQRAWQHLLDGAVPYVGLAHEDGLRFRIDEMGSVTCNGHLGVSNTMASALWVTDALFYAAREGVDGVNLHSQPGSSNGLFDLAQSAGGAWTAQIHPIYDGALMFARADPAGARELYLTGDEPAPVQTWATIGTDHLVRVLVVNDAGTRQVTIHAPAGFGSRAATVQRLTAPSASATSGLSLGGHPFATTTTGTAPAPALSSVRPGRGGYTITAPAASETLLTLRFRVTGRPGTKR